MCEFKTPPMIRTLYVGFLLIKQVHLVKNISLSCLSLTCVGLLHEITEIYLYFFSFSVVNFRLQPEVELQDALLVHHYVRYRMNYCCHVLLSMAR